MTDDAVLVRWFSDLRRTDTAVVGGKNASLGEMIVALRPSGIRVPGGFATTAEAYWQFSEETGCTLPKSNRTHMQENLLWSRMAL